MKTFLVGTPRRRLMLGIVVVLLCAGLLFGFKSYSDIQNSSPSVTLKEDIIFEYGQSNLIPEPGLGQIDINDIVDFKASKRLDYASFDVLDPATGRPGQGVGTVDTKTVGDHEGKFLAKYKDKYEEVTFKYQVVDTQKPAFVTLTDITLELGSDENVKERIKAFDPIDGEVAVVIEGDVDPNVPNTYILNASATDRNGNTNTATYVVKVEASE